MPRRAAVLGALVLSGWLMPSLGCAQPPKTIVFDDFESGSLANWKMAYGGSGGWFVYSDGKTAPDPAQSDPNVPFDVPNPHPPPASHLVDYFAARMPAQ